MLQPILPALSSFQHPVPPTQIYLLLHFHDYSKRPSGSAKWHRHLAQWARSYSRTWPSLQEVVEDAVADPCRECPSYPTRKFKLWLFSVRSSESSLQFEPYTLSQHVLKRISLKSITGIERVDLTPACLSLELANGRKYYISFDNDAVLYDWQDDIYPRSRLGNFSHTLDFVHQIHLTSDDFYRNAGRLSALRDRMQSSHQSSAIVDHRTSYELDHQWIHEQSLSPQRASYDSCYKPTGSHKRPNSASSTSTCQFVFDSSIHPTGCLTTSSPSVLLEGLYQVRRWNKRTLCAFWRSRYIVLTSRTLHICKSQVRPFLPWDASKSHLAFHWYLLYGPTKNVCVSCVEWLTHDNVPMNQTSRPESIIQLPHVVDVSQLKLKSKPFVLCFTTSDNRRYQISLPNTSDLQRWYRSIVSRSKRARISDPHGFEFHVHVSWDPKSHAFIVSWWGPFQVNGFWLGFNIGPSSWMEDQSWSAANPRKGKEVSPPVLIPLDTEGRV